MKDMTFQEFSIINRMRCEATNGFNHDLGSWSLSDWLTAIVGELGEAANVAKKLNRVRDGIPGNKHTPEELRQMFRRELADALIYMDLCAQSQGFRLGDVVLETFDAKSAEIGYVRPEIDSDQVYARDDESLLEDMRDARRLYDDPKADQRFAEGRLIGLTTGVAEHPSFLDGIPCNCDECRSNGM